MAFSSLVQVSLQLLAARHSSCTGLPEDFPPHCAAGCLVNASWLSCRHSQLPRPRASFMHMCDLLWQL